MMFIPGCLCCESTTPTCVPSPCMVDTLVCEVDGMSGPYSDRFAFAVCLARGGAFFPEINWYYQPDDGSDLGFPLPGKYKWIGSETEYDSKIVALAMGFHNTTCGWSLRGGSLFLAIYQVLENGTEDHFVEVDINSGSHGGTYDLMCALAEGAQLTFSATTFSFDDGSRSVTFKVCSLDYWSGGKPLLGPCTNMPDGSPFRQPNSYWVASGFSGDGNVASKLTKSSLTIEGYLGHRPTIKANYAGVVHITADSVSQDCVFQIFRNATSVYSYGVPNCIDPGNHPPAALSTTFSVSIGDVITLGDPTDFHNCTNLEIWWTAT